MTIIAIRADLADKRQAGKPDLRELVMNRADAFILLNEYVKDPGLVRHMLAVEAAMRAYARKFAGDEERWGLAGLMHDFDYERWPNPPDHPLKGSVILRQHG